MIFTFIVRACSDLPVAVCCRVMKVSTSGYYSWLGQPCSDRDFNDAVLPIGASYWVTLSEQQLGAGIAPKGS